MSEIENLKIYGGATYTVGNQDIIANEWEAGVTYVKGKSYVIREHKLYVCNVTHTSVEPFDVTKWTEITVGEAIAANTTAIGDLSQLTTTDKSSLVGAVNEVNGNTYTKTETDTIINSNFKRASTPWGISVTLPVDRNQFVVLVSTELFVVWFAATNTVRVRNVGANTTADGTDTVTIGGITFSRSGLRLTVTSSSSNAITIIG